MRLKLLFGILLTGTLFSCSKKSDPVPELIKPDPTYDFSFRYDPQITGIQSFELIITQLDGKILLDTLVATNTKHALQVKTKDTKLDLTTVAVNPANNSYIIRSYLQVRPDNWDIVSNPQHPLSTQTSSGIVRYINVPFGRNLFSTQQIGPVFSRSENNAIIIEYRRLIPNDIAYFLSKNAGKYIFTQIESAQHQVDFSEAKEVSKKTMPVPAGISNYDSHLFGYPKTGDYSKKILLHESELPPTTNYDVLYPSTNIEEFDLVVGYTDQQGYSHSYSYLGRSIPSEFGFKERSNFEVKSFTIDELQLAFGSDIPNTSISLWQARHGAFTGYWQVLAPSQVTAFKPKAFLEKLNAQLLKEKDLSLLKPSSITTYQVKDATYKSMLDYWANPEAILKKELKGWQVIRYHAK